MRRVQARATTTRKGLAVALIAAFAFVGAAGIAVYNLDNAYLASKFNLVAYVPDRVLAGSEATVMIWALDDDGGVRAGQPVRVFLESDKGSSEVWAGVTDDEGSATASFKAPSWSSKARLVISSGSERIETETVVDDTVRIFISTDKPVYQPGQVMHIRVLSFAGSDPLPLDAPLILEVMDPNGDKIFKKQLAPDEFGISSYDLALSDQIIQGTYTIKAYSGERSATKSVTVKDYVLPKFRVSLFGLEDWYLVDQKISGYVYSEYFFGQSLQGTYTLEASVYYGVWTHVYETSGTLKYGGFSFDVPAVGYAIGIPVAGGNGYLRLNVTVTDTGGHAETRSKLIPIAPASISLSVLTDSCVKGHESVFYAIARSPDGKAVDRCEIECRLYEDAVPVGTVGPVVTDSRGIAELRFVYERQTSMKVEAGAGSYTAARVEVDLDGGPGLKVIADKSAYDVGEQGTFDVIYEGSSLTANVYYDVVSRGYMVDRGVLKLEDGQARLVLAMTPDMEPFAQVRVYKIESDMDVSRDAITFGVGSSSALAVSVVANQTSYQPRDSVSLDFEVTSGSEPVLAALGVSIVDEAVIEVGSTMVGFEELVFGLDEEFVVPQYQVLSYVYSNSPSLPSETEVIVPELDEARMTATMAANLDTAAALVEDAVDAYWISLFLVGGMLMVGGLAFAARSGRRSGRRSLRLFAAFIVVAVLVVTAFASYAMNLGFGGTSYTDRPTRDDFAMEWESAGGIDWFDGVFDDGGTSDAPLPLTPKQPPSDAQSTIVRNYFPETWYWTPCLVTGEDGHASVSLTAPDSITSWNVSVMASTKDGLIGSGTGSVLVFQPFFVDPDIPVSVVRNDTFPLKVQVYNYLGSPQDVTVTLTEEPWFTLLSPASQSVSIPTDYVSSVTFYIRATEVGWHTVKIDADASGVSDAVAKPMRVVPDGMKVETLFNGQVENGNATSTLLLDPSRIEGAENAWVKLQGGMEAVLLEGVEAFIRFVTGCGEQSLSMLSIDILAYDTVQRLGSSPERLFEYETIVNQGIQHELMYLVKPDNGIGRGIVWFPGDRDTHPWLTSWGLLAFQDAVNAGFGLDEKIISDMQAWLLSIQDSDGSWEFPDWGIYEFNNPILKAKEIAATAYIARALMYSGIPSSSPEIVAAVDYIEGHVSEVWEDAYSLALSLLVLQQGGGSVSLRAEAAAQLDSLKQELNGTYYWNSDTNMVSDNGFGGLRVDMWGGASCTRVIETTGYAAMALYGEGTYMSVVDGAVKYLLDHRQSLGGWYSTQDTIVAFHALNTVTGAPMIEDIVARVYAEGVEVFEVRMDEFNRDVTYYVDLRPYLGSVTNVSVSASGVGTLLYSVYLAQYLPWPDELPSNQYLTLEVTYDATHIELTDSVTAHMYLLYSGPAPALKMILVDLRAPMGLSFVLPEFDSLREAGVISSYDSNDRQVVVYIMDVLSGTPVEFDYSLVPQMIITSTVQDISAWDMYDPDAMRSELGPEEFEVY